MGNVVKNGGSMLNLKVVIPNICIFIFFNYEMIVSKKNYEMIQYLYQHGHKKNR